VTFHPTGAATARPLATRLLPESDPRSPIRRLQQLCDPDSLRLLDPPHDDPIAVVAAVGRVGGRPVVCYGHDASLSAGAVGAAEAELVVRALRLARDRSVPVVAFLESAGARLQEGAAALGGFGRIFYENVALTGRVPQISVIAGLSAGGGCYSPALTDFTVMTRDAAMFLTGPGVVKEVLGEQVSVPDLGGPDVHQGNGVCHFAAQDADDAARITRELLGYLPPRSGVPALEPARPPLEPDPGRLVPRNGRKVYDVRNVVRGLADDGEFLEVAERWARNMVTGFARIEGRSVGVIANQPRHLGGVIDVHASEKGARFVNGCDRFGIPLVVLVDTPGFMPGLRQEENGIIRHGAQLVRAFAAAGVPRVTIVLRKAYGGGYITMNSKDLGASLALAWSGAEIGVMGAPAAVKLLHRRELRAAGSPPALVDRLAEDYAAHHITAWRALDDGVIDGVIEPPETRGRIVEALER
jgi:acetyl-CoA carboxylase carboxyltransferase component